MFRLRCRRNRRRIRHRAARPRSAFDLQMLRLQRKAYELGFYDRFCSAPIPAEAWPTSRRSGDWWRRRCGTSFVQGRLSGSVGVTPAVDGVGASASALQATKNRSISSASKIVVRLTSLFGTLIPEVLNLSTSFWRSTNLWICWMYRISVLRTESRLLRPSFPSQHLRQQNRNIRIRVKNAVSTINATITSASPSMGTPPTSVGAVRPFSSTIAG